MAKLFKRLQMGDDQILSENGDEDDRALYALVSEPDNRREIEEYFEVIGRHMAYGDGYVYMYPDSDEGLERKLAALLDLLHLTHFLAKHLAGLIPGYEFSSIDLANSCQGDADAEDFLNRKYPADSLLEQVGQVLRELNRKGYILDLGRDRYRVLAAVNYLMEFGELIHLGDKAEGDVE